MIHITKGGKNDRLMVGTCEKCGCEVECMSRDTTPAARGQDMQIVRFIACPSCNETLYVKEKE